MCRLICEITSRKLRSHSLPANSLDRFSTPSKLLSARSVPCGRAYRPVGIDCIKAQCLSACLPPRHPNSQLPTKGGWPRH